MKYDVFVSYRRSSFESANLIAEKLRSMGYSVFFDVESLRSGNFNEQLFNVIDNCSDFVLVLPPNALDRCVNEDDWVRKEVIHAMRGKKNIIPVMLTGFEWPTPMPNGLEELSQYQAISAGEREYFDMSMKRLAGYLKSKPHRNMRQFYKKAGVVLATILVLVSIGMFALRQSMMPLYKNVASNLAVGMSILDILYGDSKQVMGYWEDVVRSYNLCKTDESRETIYNQFNKNLDKMIEDTKLLHQQFSRLPAFTSKDATLLGFYNITTQEIEGFYGLFDAMFNDHLNSLAAIRSLQEQKLFLDNDILHYQMKKTELGFEMFGHMLDNLFYSYMEVMSKFPKYAQEQHVIQSPAWSNFPRNVGLDKSIEEYRLYQEEAYNKAEKVMVEMEKSASEFRGKVEVLKESAANK